jgi:hypothetical protein
MAVNACKPFSPFERGSRRVEDQSVSLHQPAQVEAASPKRRASISTDPPGKTGRSNELRAIAAPIVTLRFSEFVSSLHLTPHLELVVVHRRLDEAKAPTLAG